MNHQVVLGQGSLVSESQISTLRQVLLADEMLFLVMVAQVLDIPIHLELNQARLLVSDFLPKLLADVAKVVFNFIVFVQGVDVIELRVIAELAAWVVKVLVLVQRAPLVERLLEQQHWLLFEAELAVVEPVVFVQMVLQGSDCRELAHFIL